MDQKNVFSYVRVSTQDQAEKQTHENQLNEINKFSKKLGLNIVESFQDLAISGMDNTRPQFLSMLDKIDSVDGIIIYDLDRLTRDFQTGVNLIFMLKNKKKTLYLARSQNVQEFNDSSDQLISIIRAWVSSEERNKIKERQALGIQRYKENNKGLWGRRVKKIDWKDFERYKETYNGSIAAYCRAHKISLPTFYRRLNERLNEGIIENK